MLIQSVGVRWCLWATSLSRWVVLHSPLLCQGRQFLKTWQQLTGWPFEVKWANIPQLTPIWPPGPAFPPFSIYLQWYVKSSIFSILPERAPSQAAERRLDKTGLCCLREWEFWKVPRVGISCIGCPSMQNLVLIHFVRVPISAPIPHCASELEHFST